MMVLARDDSDHYAVVLNEGRLKIESAVVPLEVCERAFLKFQEKLRTTGPSMVQFCQQGMDAETLVKQNVENIGGMILDVKKVLDPRTDVAAWVGQVKPTGPKAEQLRELLETGSDIVGLGYLAAYSTNETEVSDVKIFSYNVVELPEPESKRAVVFSKHAAEAVRAGFDVTFKTIIDPDFWDKTV